MILTGKVSNTKSKLQEIKKEIRRRIKRLRTERVEVYYCPKWGYLIVACAVQKDSVAWLAVPPLDTATAEVSARELGAKIREGLQKSKEAGFVDRKDVEDFKFWKMTGIKGIDGFKAFSKRFQCVAVARNGKAVRVEKMRRDSYGAYVSSEDVGCCVELFVGVSDEMIGHAVLGLLDV